MYINDVRSSNEYRLQQVLHTLKSVHGTDLDLDNSSDTDLDSLRERSEIVKNSIVSESRFNTYNANPEYAKHILILEAVKLYLTEIAPKRRRSVKEGIEHETDGMAHSVTGMITGEEELEEKTSMADLGRKMMDYSTKQRPDPKDEREMRILNVISDVGDKLTRIGEPFGPRGLTDMDKRVIEVAKRRMGMSQMKQSSVTDDSDSLQGLAEMNPAQSPEMQGQTAIKPGMIKVKKDNQEKDIPASQLDSMRKQGFNVVGDEVNEYADQPANTELEDLMRTYGIDSDDQRVDEKFLKSSKPNYHRLAKKHAKAADAAFDSHDESDFTRHTDLSTYYRIKAGHKPPKQVVDIPRFMKYVENNYSVEDLNESVDVKEAMFDHDSYQASMARSELYRNTKYAMDMLKIIKPGDEIQPWIASNLTKAASYLDKIFHYLDYYTKFEPEKLPEDEDLDPGTRDMALGETTGSIARQDLMMIVEYSTKLFNMIQPGDRLEGWVAMKLTTASDAISSSKHYLEYTQFEKHASDMLGNVASMAEEGSKMSKKKIRESVGQMLMQMMLNEDQDLAQAQTLLAAKALSDDLQDMAEKVAKMSVEDLMPLVDTMKEQFGPEAANGYNAAMKQSLEALLDSTTAAKDASDNAIMQLQGGGVPAVASDIESADLAAPELPGDEEDDGLGGTPAASGPEEEPLGRAKKDESISRNGNALNEKWDAKMKTKEKDKGMWDGWTIAELKSEKAKLMKKEKRSAAEQKKVKQIDFAIRAKQEGKGKWGKIKKESINEGAVSNTIRVLVALGLGAYALGSLVNKDVMDMPLAKAMAVAASKGDTHAAEELKKLNVYVEASDLESLDRLKDLYLPTKGDPVVKEDSLAEMPSLRPVGKQAGRRAAASDKIAYDTKMHGRRSAPTPAEKGELSKASARSEIEKATADYEKSGGKITKVSPSTKRIKESKVVETAPPGEEAEEWITKNKPRFIKQYGKKKGMRILYSKAWKDFGESSDQYKNAKKMLEATEINRAKLVKAFESHKAQFNKMLKEGKADDPLALGYGLEGEVILEKISGLDGMIGKLKEMIAAEMKSGILDIMAEEVRTKKVAKLESAKAAAPYGVMWKDNAGKKMSKFFENAEQRKYWLGLNSESMVEHRLVEPKHFDEQIKKLSRKG